MSAHLRLLQLDLAKFFDTPEERREQAKEAEADGRALLGQAQSVESNRTSMAMMARQCPRLFAEIG